MARRRNRKAAPKRRRTNPATVPVILANPRRGRRRRARRANPSMGKIRGMVAGMVRAGKRRRRVRKTNPHNAARRIVRRRRSNPSMGGMTIGQIVRIGAFGGLGIVTARIAGYLYTKHLAPIVAGDAAPGTMRAMLSDVGRIVAQEAAILVIAKTASRAGIGNPADRLAFTVGGTAETARGAVGMTLARLSPSSNRGAYGLDAPDLAGYIGSDGRAYAFDSQTGSYQLMDGGGDYSDDAGDLAGLEEAEAFEGLEEAEAFE